jgi:hypothetical protein
MCFTVKKDVADKIYNGKLTPLVAEEDIECFKPLFFFNHLNGYVSEINNTFYEPLKIQPKVELKLYSSVFGSWINGYSAYSIPIWSFDYYQTPMGTKKMPLPNGRMLKFEEIGLFLIPKGTLYYKDDYEYVAETIVFHYIKPQTGGTIKRLLLI